MLRKIRTILAIFFRVDHVVVFRLHGNVAHVDGMDGKNTIPACAAGIERRCRDHARCADTTFRPHLLLRHLPVGRHAGYCFVDKR